MHLFRFVKRLLLQNIGKLRRQAVLLAGLSLFCLFIAWQAGKTAENLLNEGVDFHGLTIAISTPEEDGLGETLVSWLGRLQDLKSYCSFLPLPVEEAEEALRRGEIHAILVLPDNFIHGVLVGSNPDVTLLVSSQRPLEALLTNWVGGSATELLMTFQQGIYAVLETYDHIQPEDVPREDIVFEINLRYINWTLGRQTCFRSVTVGATDGLPLAQHYRLSLLAYFLLTMGSILAPLYTTETLTGLRRLRCLGYGAAPCYFSSVAAGALLFSLVSLAFLLLSEIPLLHALPVAGIWGLFVSLRGSLLCLLVRDSASRGMLSFLAALLSLFLSGGILPPVLLPFSLRTVGKLTLLSGLRDSVVGSPASALPVLSVHLTLLFLLGFLFYQMRMREGTQA